MVLNIGLDSRGAGGTAGSASTQLNHTGGRADGSVPMRTPAMASSATRPPGGAGGNSTGGSNGTGGTRGNGQTDSVSDNEIFAGSGTGGIDGSGSSGGSGGLGVGAFGSDGGTGQA